MTACKRLRLFRQFCKFVLDSLIYRHTKYVQNTFQMRSGFFRSKKQNPETQALCLNFRVFSYHSVKHGDPLLFHLNAPGKPNTCFGRPDRSKCHAGASEPLKSLHQPHRRNTSLPTEPRRIIGLLSNFLRKGFLIPARCSGVKRIAHLRKLPHRVSGKHRLICRSEAIREVGTHWMLDRS